MPARHLLAALVLAVVAPLTRGNTYTVQAGGGADFATLDAAVAAVAAGDTLVVLDTQFMDTAIDKSLTIRGGPLGQIVGHGWVEWSGTTRASDGTAIIIDAGPDSRVVLRDLVISGDDAESWGMNGADGVRAESVGTLIIERCTIEAGDMWISLYYESHGDLQEGVEIRSADRVILRDCTVQGGKGCFNLAYVGGSIYPSNGGAALNLGGATLALIERSELFGGDGGDCVRYWPWSQRGYGPSDDQGTDGGAGLLVGVCPDVTVTLGKQVGGRRGKYLVDWLDSSTWVGWLGFTPGEHGPRVDGRINPQQVGGRPQPTPRR